MTIRWLLRWMVLMQAARIFVQSSVGIAQEVQGAVLGSPLDYVGEVKDRKVLANLASILDNQSHPLWDTLSALEGRLSDRILCLQCVREIS